ncbi:acyl-CoA thioesterase [Sneathiella aquimaris]|uniref:acyl-CoA thioesterase n=1 Tax=Sneathiella aquimaris TaxID=2599305 RepID=UPI00146A4AB4|nr:thioesterase family protein [Sneathiella aquimaris]
MAREDFGFFFDFRVRYSEIDGQGIVFNAHYLTYFDTAITEYLRRPDFNYSEFVKQSGADFHLVKSLVNYERPIEFDAEIQVGCRTEKIGNSSITFILEIFEKNGDKRYANGEIIWVLTDQKSHKTMQVPDEIRAIVRSIDLQYQLDTGAE